MSKPGAARRKVNGLFFQALRPVYSYMNLSLPYPPSMNHYWRRAGRFIHISREGREFRANVTKLLAKQHIDPMLGRLAVRIHLQPPDRRRRDIDNVQKPLLDALQHGGAYEDDCQIDWLLTERGEKTPGGSTSVTIKPHEPGGSCPLCGSLLRWSGNS
jgi:crossover junction endodeoxyribonuclease RusA